MKKLLSITVLPILAFLIPISVYFFTLSPAVVPGDSMEMVTAAVNLGVPHQPSYPVNTLFGFLFSKIPVPLDVVARVNAVSAFFQASSVLVFYFLVKELISEVEDVTEAAKSIVAFTASMFLAFNLIFWQYATKFEVFPLNNLFIVLILLLAVRIGFRTKELTKKEKTELHHNKKKRKFFDKRFLLLAFLTGLAFTHHQTVVFIFPVVAFLVGRKLPDLLRSKKGLILTTLSFLAGLVPFFVLLILIASRKPALNWGEVEGLDGAFSALVRRDFGTFSSYLAGFEPEIRPYPIDQVIFYFKSLLTDFSIVGVILIPLGIVFLWKKQKYIFYVITLGVLLSGFLFLSYANFPLQDSFNQATVRRFHMMPNIFAALFIAFGILYIYQFFQSPGVRKIEGRLGLGLGKVYLALIFVFPLYMNISRADNHTNTLTSSYVNHAFAKTPENALIMLSGDIPNMSVDYFRIVAIEEQDNRTTFSPGQFHLPWFTPQLTERYPDLVIPEPEEGKFFTTATQVIDANYGKWPIYLGPDLVIHSADVEEKYTLYPKHLLFLVKKKGEDLNLEDWREENENLWEGVDIDQIRRVQNNPPMFEETIVFHYARHFHNVGFVYEEVGLHEDAIREYKRAVEINPLFKEALSSLGRVYGYKLDPPDYFQAIDYLGRYQSVLDTDEIELGQAAQSMIFELQDMVTKEAEEYYKMQEIEAATDSTPSAESEN